MSLSLHVHPHPRARRRVLGIDPGTHCGFAVVDVDDRISVVASGVWELGSDVRRWSRLHSHLLQALRDHRPDLVAYEQVHRHLGTDAAHVYGGLVAILQFVADGQGYPVVGVGVGRLKQRATGKGNADKSAVQVEAMRVLGRAAVPTSDEADALFVGLAAADDFQPEPAL